MNAYNQFVDKLKHHLSIQGSDSSLEWKKQATRFVDGLAAEELRQLVDIDTRRQYGAFFTASDTAASLFVESELDFSGNCVFYDPAVGAGNLLIAARNAAGKSASNITLLGTDLHPEFIAAAGFRHQINEALKDEASTFAIELFVRDGLVDNLFYNRATHIVTNPPFHQVVADKDIKWASGKVSAAALFIDKIIAYTKPETFILAILPDVLRSGSRYEKWREMVEKTCVIYTISMLGQFDKYADVDVFSIILRKKTIGPVKKSRVAWKPIGGNEICVETLYDVSVGNVVDNRDEKTGVLLPFVVSRGLEGWKEINAIQRQRRFKGKSINSPFVVIKRTSRMGDKYRATATIINISSPVYVDNHLIVVRPKSGSLTDCKKLIEKLRSEEVNGWIDQQIRCRHLTVKVVSKIPL